MESQNILKKQHQMLEHLCNLPRKILELHEVSNTTEFVLHDLCQEQCLNLEKAAYFVDNPDFNCTQGVTGFSREEAFQDPHIWQNPKGFSDHMRNASFNKKVRSLSRCSLKKSDDVQKELAETIAHDLGFKDYAFCSWGMRHDNHGFVVYERTKDCDVATQEYIANGLALLSFCPLFW